MAAEPEALRGLERPRIDEWLLAHVSGAQPPFAFQLIAAGGSNLTYRFEDARGVVRVLRRPPAKSGLATAHDMQREWRVLRALGEPPWGEQPLQAPLQLPEVEAHRAVVEGLRRPLRVGGRWR